MDRVVDRSQERGVAIKNSTGDEGAVIVKGKAGGPRFYGKWRDPSDRSKQVELPIGPAWIVPAGAKGARPNGQTIGRIVDADTREVRPRWCDRAGSPPEGWHVDDRVVAHDSDMDFALSFVSSDAHVQHSFSRTSQAPVARSSTSDTQGHAELHNEFATRRDMD